VKCSQIIGPSSLTGSRFRRNSPKSLTHPATSLPLIYVRANATQVMKDW